MTALLVSELGQGPDLVLLHGVGLGPESFEVLARLLSIDHHVVVLERPGQDRGALGLDEQAAAVADAVLEHGCHRPTLAGVSGGATLALALAIERPEVLGAVVLHEPLVGHHAPDLHDLFERTAALAATGDVEALAVVRAVIGEPTWQHLSDGARTLIEERAGWARREIPLFAAFDPSAEQLRSLRRLPVLTTVGARSGPERQDAALVLRELAGADVSVVPGAGNAVQVDAPDAFATAIRAWRPSPIRSGG